MADLSPPVSEAFMRKSLIVLLVVGAALVYAPPSSVAQTAAAPAFQTAGTDAAKVEAFLKTLQGALAIDNHLKVASLVKYPISVWADGETITVRNDSDLLAHYRQIFDPSLRKSIASARVDTLSSNADGVMLDGGRMCFKAASDKNGALKIVKISEPGSGR